MKLPDRFDDPHLRRWAPVGAVAAAAILAVVVPSREHQLIDAAIDAGPAYAAADVVDATAAPETPPPSAPPLTSTTSTRPPRPAAHQEPTARQPEAATPAVSVGDDRSAGPPVPTAPPDTRAELRIVKHTWAQRPMWAGTPFDDAPQGTLPVAAMVGDPHRISYLEITGTATTLRLPVYEGDDSRDHLAGTAAVSACRVISQGWERQDGQTFSSAPAHDPDDCADGAPGGDGTHWEWDVAPFSTGGGRFSVALVPTAGSAGSWHISFTPEVHT